MKVIGLISLRDAQAFEDYRQRVADTITQYGGKVLFRGRLAKTFWNELDLCRVDSMVEIDFPDAVSATRWAAGPEYQALLTVRAAAMRLTLLGFEPS